MGYHDISSRRRILCHQPIGFDEKGIDAMVGAQ